MEGCQQRGWKKHKQKLSDVDIREEKTGDEEETIDGQEEAERVDEDLERATAARSIIELETEISYVQNLAELARSVYNLKSESKFEKLWEALQEYQDTKVLIFTEHRDTMNFIIERLEALGFTGKVAQIHGGMKYSQREEQVEFFRDPNGAQYLVATDAAGRVSTFNSAGSWSTTIFHGIPLGLNNGWDGSIDTSKHAR